MSKISATGASKRFAGMLDAVEHRGETFTGGHADRAAGLPDDADVGISAISAFELFVGVELADDEHRDRRREMVQGTIVYHRLVL